MTQTNEPPRQKKSQTDSTKNLLPSPIEVDSTDLFQGARDITIVHNSVRYRLQITRQDKLILTK